MNWLLGTLFVLLAALAFQLGLLAFAMYVLLALLLVSRFLAKTWIENLSAVRGCDRTSAQIGDTATVVILLKNQGKLPVPWVLLEDVLPGRLAVGAVKRVRVLGKRTKISLIRGGAEVRFFYRIVFEMRGYYQLGPLVMESGDLFGLHRRYRVETKPHYVLVYPKVVPLEGYELASRRPIGEVRLTHRLYEDPTRIAGVRDYQRGDPLSRVHWRATARTGSLHSKIFEPSTIIGATILLDFHLGGYHQRGEPFRSELAVTAAASLASALYELGQQVGLVTNGRDAADRIREEGWERLYDTRQAAQATAAAVEESDRLRPQVVETRRGPEQLMRILETLARVELTDGLTCAQLIAETASRLPRDATVLAILAEVTPETAEALGSLRHRGYAVTAILVMFDDEAFEEAYARLAAAGIDVRHLKEEAGLAALCRQHVLR